MKIRIETITPSSAERYLAKTKRNRSVKASHLRELEQAMSTGAFLTAGDPIRFNSQGELIDGQHRLLACIHTGTHFDAVIVTQLEPKAQDVIDTGLRRSHADIFQLKGYTNTNNLTATLRWLWRFDNHWETSYPLRPQVADLEDTFWKHPRVKESLTIGNNIRALIPAKSLGSALWVLFIEKHLKEAEEFFKQLHTGLGLHLYDPVHALRMQLIKNSARKAKLPPHAVAAITIKAFNACVEGKRVRSLRWITSGENAEPFPTIL